MSLLQTAALLGSLAASVSAHGLVQGIVAGGKWYEGYNPSFQYADPPPTVIGWSIPEDQGFGFVAPDAYSNPDIICHLGAKPAGTSAKVAAGSVVELQWTQWPDSHHGPVMDHLAKCPGSCSNVDKTTLEFFKIDEVGLVNDNPVPGSWGSDQLIANNNSWTVTIPKSITPGNYVLRHEIIALHSAGTADGAQNYPQCINLQITGSGSEQPTGTLGTKLYKMNDPGIVVNIYTDLATYKIPGPSLIADAVSMKQTQLPIGGNAPVSSTAYGGSSSAAAASSSAAPSSGAAVSSSAAPASYSVPSATSSIVGPASGSSVPVVSSSSVPAPVSGSSSYPAYGSSSVAASASGSASYPGSSASCAAPISGSSSAGCTKQTITVSSAVLSSASYAPSGSSIAPVSVSSSAPASYPVISSIVSALPTGAMTQTVPALPTGSAYPTGGAPGGYGSMPSKPLPEGFTFKDVMEWFAYMMKQLMREARHGRDFQTR